jgi:hypothetical protein
MPLSYPRSGLWRHGDFMRLWTGETISIFGTLVGGLALKLTAIGWLGAGAGQIALLQVCETVPSFVLGPWAGVWVDRLRKRPLMIVSDIVRFAALASVAVAALFDVLTIWQLCLVLLVTSAARVFFDVAYEAYLPALVERDDLVEANAKLTASASVAEVGGFGISGWLVQLISGPGAVFVDAVSFLFSALFLGRIRRPEPPRAPAHEREHWVREAIDGAQVVIANPVLRTFAIENLVTQFSTSIIGVTFLVYLTKDLDFAPGPLAMVFAIGGITSLFGSYVAARPQLYGSVGPALVVALFVRALGASFMPLAAGVTVVGWALLMLNQVVTDPAWVFYEVHEVSIRQAITPDRFLGRVNATMRFGGFGASLAGIGAAVVIGDAASARVALFVAAGCLAAGGIVLLASPVAKLRGQPAPIDVG